VATRSPGRRRGGHDAPDGLPEEQIGDDDAVDVLAPGAVGVAPARVEVQTDAVRGIGHCARSATIGQTITACADIIGEAAVLDSLRALRDEIAAISARLLARRIVRAPPTGSTRPSGNWHRGLAGDRARRRLGGLQTRARSRRSRGCVRDSVSRVPVVTS
jgi:hypothetical protein